MDSPKMILAIGFFVALMSAAALSLGAETPAVPPHPIHRPLPPISDRPMSDGPAVFVDAAKGNDESDGNKEAPWKTLKYALTQLKPGDTLYLREGLYYETIQCSLTGTLEQPITIRS